MNLAAGNGRADAAKSRPVQHERGPRSVSTKQSNSCQEDKESDSEEGPDRFVVIRHWLKLQRGKVEKRSEPDFSDWSSDERLA